MKNRVLGQKELYIYIGIVLWFVVKNQFYQYVGFPQAASYANIATIFTACMLLYCIRDILDIGKHRIVSFTMIGVLMSYGISIVFWGASPYRALQAHSCDVGLLYVVVFFALRKFTVEKKTIEYIMITLALIYLFCWGYSLYKMPEMVFGIDRDGEYGDITERGFYRLFIPGNVSAVLSFYFLNSYLNKHKVIYLALTLGMFVVVVLHVGRQMILWTMITSALMIYMHYRKKIIYLVIAVVVVYSGLSYAAQKMPAISSMIEMTEEQKDNYEDDIRMEASKYYLFEYPHEHITAIFGNGVPALGTELYQIRNRACSRGYYQTDVGFFAMYCNYGLWGIVCFFFLILRVIRLKVEPQYEYFKYYIYCIFGSYFMSQALTASIFTLMLSYYVLERSAIDVQSDKSLC